MNLVAIFLPFGVGVAVWLVLAKLIAGRADEERRARKTGAGALEFAPNRRAFWAVACFTALLAYLMAASLLHGIRSGAELVVPALCAGFVGFLFTAFPGTIRVDQDGLEQVYWLRGTRRIAWSRIARFSLSKRGEVRVEGDNGVRIVHTPQLPDRMRLLEELDRHASGNAAVEQLSETFAMSGPAA